MEEKFMMFIAVIICIILLMLTWAILQPGFIQGRQIQAIGNAINQQQNSLQKINSNIADLKIKLADSPSQK